MPELPEVETVRRGLQPLLAGRRLERVRIRDARLTRPCAPGSIAARLQGRNVASVGRRGKYLLLDLDDERLIVHLRMTGSFRHWPGGRPDRDRHVRATLALDDGSVVTYRDVRRFGTWELLAAADADAYLAARLGPEPLEEGWTARDLHRALTPRGAPAKALLLDQRVVAGVGNIYADEALWLAGIHPLRPGRSIGPDEAAALRRAVRRVLRLGIARQGATLRDYRDTDGASGAMQDEFAVYGRAGEPCVRCGVLLQTIRVGGRTTTFCSACQERR